MHIKAGGKAILIALVVGTVAFGYNWADNRGYFSSKQTQASSVPPRMDIPTSPGVSPVANIVPAGSSSVALAPSDGTYTARMLVIPWNAQMGLMYANGDALTAAGSLMHKAGVRLKIERQDDYAQMLTEQVKFAKQVAAGVAQPSEGAAFVVIMGDGYPAYIAGAQESLSKLGQQLQVIGAVGYSRGEDKCMLPAAVKVDASKAKGSLIGAVIRDGDWNICVKWASDNGIGVNPDEKTYDPNAMNFVAVNAFTEADEKLIAGYCEDRPVVSNGKRTGETRKVCQNGTATWTPGDVKVAREKGGVVSIASTKEYMWQMPATVIGNKQWMDQNPLFTQNLLAAALKGGELVRGDDSALDQGAVVAAKVFNEENAAYWKKYYKGVQEQDRTGQLVQLGGSTAIGVADNAFLFGLNGNDNLYKRVYNVFGQVASKYYPDVMPKVVPYDQVVTVKHLQAIVAKAKDTGKADVPIFSQNAPTTGTFAKKVYAIEFETGKATFTPTAMRTLEDLLNQVAVSGLTVQVNGHTDNIGNPQSNIALSKARAEAVKSFLVTNAGSSFPADRVRTRGYGDTTPVSDNATTDGRARNRRVEVLLLTTN